MEYGHEVKVLADLFRTERQAVVLTGAGISTESGIPDFRSRGTGLWNRIDPMEYLSADALYSQPEVFWRHFAAVFGPTLAAEPNIGHKAVARLEDAGYIRAVVTQNIDGLHQEAGSKTVLEVHGHLRTVHCSRCQRKYPLSQVLQDLEAMPIPRCQYCSGSLRPDVVLFGDMMPPAFSRAVEVVEQSTLMLVVGSSLMVSPANSLAFRTKHLAIINREPTPADGRADVVIHAGAGETLQSLLKELQLG
ncbi:MAG: SIR2 family NAD-dependent protein deacylase [bacterium]